MMPGSRYAKAVMVVVTVIIILGLLASAVASPISV
jgi:hypothetical protein